MNPAPHIDSSARESIWTTTLFGRVKEIEMHPDLVPAFDSLVVNKKVVGDNYRLTLGGDGMRPLVVHMHAKSAKRAVQFAYAYTRCRWLNNKQTPPSCRDTRRVWVTDCTLYHKAKS